MEYPVAQTNLPEGFIDLGLGNPTFSLLPLELLREAAAACFAKEERDFLQYGYEQGSGPFRQTLANFLSHGYAQPVNPAELFITSGASGGLDLLCTLFTQPGDVIFVEEPSYYLALRIFRDHKLRMVPIPTDADGLNLDALAEALGSVHPKFIYVIPTHQNPSGATLSADRRTRLVSLAREHDFLVVADEVYHFLNYSGLPPAPLAVQAGGGNLIAVNSFSKILAPGLRLGWIQAEEKLIRKISGCGVLDSGGGMNPFTSAIVQQAILSGGLNENIEKLKAVYAGRLAGMAAAMHRHLPEMQFETPTGGFFIWARLAGMDTFTLQEKGRRRQVDFRPGALFSSRDGLHEFMRLSFAFYELEEIETGLQRLQACLEEA